MKKLETDFSKVRALQEDLKFTRHPDTLPTMRPLRYLM